MKPELKVKIVRKAQRLHLSVSRLMILGALSYVDSPSKGGRDDD